MTVSELFAVITAAIVRTVSPAKAAAAEGCQQYEGASGWIDEAFH